MECRSTILTVSVSLETVAEFDRLAATEVRNKNEFFGEMLRVYRVWRETQQFESLQRFGASRAQGLGIRDESDVERLIQDVRDA